MIKKRCFAENKHGECELLLRYIKKDCAACGFFKTRAEFETGRERALKRLRGLDEITRRNIAKKYKIKLELLNVPLQLIDRAYKMMQIWGQATGIAKFAIVMYFALPALLILLAWVAETEG